MRAKAWGLLDKFTETNFRPNEPITWEEMSVILAAAVRLEGFDLTSNLIDLSAAQIYLLFVIAGSDPQSL